MGALGDLAIAEAREGLTGGGDAVDVAPLSSPEQRLEEELLST